MEYETPVLGTFGTLETDVAEAVSMAESFSTSAKPRLEGMGIYLELPSENGSQTTQMMITPQGKDDKSKDVGMAIIHRTVSTWSPRKQWRVNRVQLSSDELAMSPQDQALKMTDQVERVLKRNVMYGLTSLQKQPIVFELTDLDFADIRDWKAPASALRRIIKARASLGFPEKLTKSS
jgi:hypothetical protein